MNRVKDMTSGNPTKLLLLFALPLILGNLGQQLYMIVDAIIVGQGVGVKALAAVGATDWTYWLVLWTVQALTQGIRCLYCQTFWRKGSRKTEKVHCHVDYPVCWDWNIANPYGTSDGFTDA